MTWAATPATVAVTVTCARRSNRSPTTMPSTVGRGFRSDDLRRACQRHRRGGRHASRSRASRATSTRERRDGAGRRRRNRLCATTPGCRLLQRSGRGTDGQLHLYGRTAATSAIVAVTVTCVDDDPFANDDADTVERGLPEPTVRRADQRQRRGWSDAIEIIAVTESGARHGARSQGAPGSDLTYTPGRELLQRPGPPDRRLHLHGRTAATPATVAVTVTCVDDDTVADDDAETVIEDTVANDFEVLGNDTDADAVDDDRAHSRRRHRPTARASIDGADTGVRYTPDADYCNDPGAAPSGRLRSTR